MGMISAWMPDELEDELETYLDAENIDRPTAIRKLLAEGLKQWRHERALQQLAAGEVTFANAANIADMTVWEFEQLAKERNALWVLGEHQRMDLEDI